MISKADTVLNETLLHKSSGKDLLRLSQFYGFEKPAYIKDSYYQEMLKKVVFSARGTLGVMFDFYESLFKEFSQYSTYTMTVTNANTLEYTGSETICNFDGRLCRINNKMYYVSYSTSSYLVFSNVNTSYWSKADFTGTSLDVEILPFIFSEYDGFFTLNIDASLFVVPPTYLNEDNEQQDVSEPYGGHLMDFFSNDPVERFGNQDTGAYPAYLVVDFFEKAFFEISNKLLASGIILRGKNLNWCEDALPIYASITDLLRYGTVNPNETNIVTPARI